jgi:hypothetical protein
MKILVSYVVALLVSASAFAGEPSVSVGGSGGIVVPFHTGNFNFVNPQYNNTDIGKSRYSFSSGMGFQSAANGVFTLDKTGRFSLATTFGYSQFTSHSDKEGDDYPSRLANGDTVTTRTYFYNEYSQKSLFTNIDLRCKPFESNEFGIIAGVSGSYIFSYNFVFDPSSGRLPDLNLSGIKPVVRDYEPRYADDTRTNILLYMGELPDIQRFQASLRAGVFYDIPLSEIIVSPSIVYHFPLTKVSSSQTWRISTVSCTIDVRVPL